MIPPIDQEYLNDAEIALVPSEGSASLVGNEGGSIVREIKEGIGSLLQDWLTPEEQCRVPRPNSSLRVSFSQTKARRAKQIPPDYVLGEVRANIPGKCHEDDVAVIISSRRIDTVTYGIESKVTLLNSVEEKATGVRASIAMKMKKIR